MAKGVLQSDGTYMFPMNTTCMECGKPCEVVEEVDVYIQKGKTDWWCYCRKCNVETFHPSSGYKTEDASDI